MTTIVGTAQAPTRVLFEETSSEIDEPANNSHKIDKTAQLPDFDNDFWNCSMSFNTHDSHTIALLRIRNFTTIS
jgi:hypothetical protein